MAQWAVTKALLIVNEAINALRFGLPGREKFLKSG